MPLVCNRPPRGVRGCPYSQPVWRRQTLSPLTHTQSEGASFSSFSVNSRGTVSGTSPYSLKAVHVGFPRGGLACPGVSPRELQKPVAWSLCIVNPEGDNLPLLVGCPTDGLPQLTRQYRVLVPSGYCIIRLLSSAGGSALHGRPFRLNVSYQACMETPLPEVYPPVDPIPDISGPADT